MCVCVCVCVCVSQVATQPDNELMRKINNRLVPLERTRFLRTTTAVTTPAEFYEEVTKENHKKWFIEVDLKSTHFNEALPSEKPSEKRSEKQVMGSPPPALIQSQP